MNYKSISSSVSGNNLRRQGSTVLTGLMQLLLNGRQLPSSVCYFQMVNESHITCTLHIDTGNFDCFIRMQVQNFSV